MSEASFNELDGNHRVISSLSRPIDQEVNFKIMPADISEDWVFMDIVWAVLLIILLTPLLILISLPLILSGSVFYRQVRVGRNGELFKIIKFRTMVHNAETNSGAVLSYEGDPRVTSYGRFLRKTHFDELPQLLNVVAGDMAFIGPRPERPEFTTTYTQNIRYYDSRHMIRPGITGLAQIKLAYDASALEKLRYDLFYIKNKQSLSLNLKIIFGTIFKMFGLSNLQGVLVQRIALSMLAFLVASNSEAEVTQKISMKQTCKVEGPIMLYPEQSDDLLVMVQATNNGKLKQGQKLNIAVYGRLAESSTQRLMVEGESSPLACLDGSCARIGFTYRLPAKKVKKLKPESFSTGEFTLKAYSSFGNLEEDGLHINLVKKDHEILAETRKEIKVIDETLVATNEFVDNRHGDTNLIVTRENWALANQGKYKDRYQVLSPALLYQNNLMSFVFLPDADLSTTEAIATPAKIVDLFSLPDFNQLTRPMDFKASPYAMFWVRPRSAQYTRDSFDYFEGGTSKYVLLPGQRGQFFEMNTTFSIEYQKWGANSCGLATPQEKIYGEKVVKHEELKILE